MIDPGKIVEQVDIVEKKHLSAQFEAELISLNDSDAIINEWIALSQEAVEPCPFYEPDFLLAVDRHVKRENKAKLILIRDKNRSGELVGLFPVVVKNFRRKFPLPITALLMNRMMSTGTPLMKGENGSAIWACFIDFVTKSKKLPSVIYYQELNQNGMVHDFLQILVDEGCSKQQTVSSFHKAAVTSNQKMKDYVQRWSKNKRRNVKRRQNKLSELGDVTYSFVNASDSNFKKTLDVLLSLEASGWKGRGKTALLSNQETRKLAESIYYHPRHGLQTVLACLAVNDKIIAGTINLVSQDVMYSVKGAYDETYASYGPGILLDVWMLEQILEQDTICELDSCTHLDHPLREIWLDDKVVEGGFLVRSSPLNAVKLKCTAYCHKQFLWVLNLTQETARLTNQFDLKKLVKVK